MEIVDGKIVLKESSLMAGAGAGAAGAGPSSSSPNPGGGGGRSGQPPGGPDEQDDEEDYLEVVRFNFDLCSISKLTSFMC